MVGLCFTSHIASFLFTDLKWLHFNPRISQQFRPNGPENSHVLLALVTYCSYPYLDQRQHISSSHLSEIREVFISVYVPQFVGPQSWSNFHQDRDTLFCVCMWFQRSTPYPHTSYHCSINPSRKPFITERVTMKLMVGDVLSEGFPFHWVFLVGWFLEIGSLVPPHAGLNLLCSTGWPWTPASTSWVIGLHAQRRIYCFGNACY